MKRFLLLFCLLPALFTAGCTYRKEELPVPGQGACDTLQVAYGSGAIHEIVTTKCAISGCHVSGGQGAGDFLVYANLQAVAVNGELYNHLFVAKDMPKTGSLDSCQYAQLAAWINAGAPE
jgi:hypothetical protein